MGYVRWLYLSEPITILISNLHKFTEVNHTPQFGGDTRTPCTHRRAAVAGGEACVCVLISQSTERQTPRLDVIYRTSTCVPIIITLEWLGPVSFGRTFLRFAFHHGYNVRTCRLAGFTQSARRYELYVFNEKTRARNAAATSGIAAIYCLYYWWWQRFRKKKT